MKRFLLILTVFIQYIVPAAAQTEVKRIERLTSLAKIWGKVKYFHPYLPYREIDWDKALIEAIPEVSKAKSSEEFNVAINRMLAVLNDPQSKAFIDTVESKQGIRSEKVEPLRLENGILTLNVLAAARFSAQSNQNAMQMPQRFFTQVQKAKVLIIDSRIGNESDEGVLYESDQLIKIIVPALTDKKMTVSTIRYRVHNGYAPHEGVSSGGYYSSMTTDIPSTFGEDGKKAYIIPRTIIIADDNSTNAPIFSALKNAGKAFIVSEAEDIGTAISVIKLSDSVSVKFRTVELVNSNGSIGFIPDTLAPKGQAMAIAQRIAMLDEFVPASSKTSLSTASLVSAQEKKYGDMEFPAKEYRLLALFRFWNVMEYFYPYKNLTGTNWDELLPKYIPQFEADRDAQEYRFTVGKMVAEIHDSHGFINFPRLKNPPRYFLPPTVEAFAENQTYIRAVFDSTSEFKVGDVVLEVDGEPISQLLQEKYAVRIAASTPQAMMRDIHSRGILRGEKDSKLVCKVRGVDGKIRIVNAVRNITSGDSRFTAFDNGRYRIPAISILPSGYGYVDLDRLQSNEVDSMFETIKNTPAVIFDMRGYPNGTAWPIAPRLSEKNQPVAALFDNPLLEAKNLSNLDYSLGSNFTFAQQIPKRSGEVYKGRIVMLIDENAQSQSEHTCLFFEAARPDIVFIGTPTAGANGDVTNLVLPGNIRVSFSGHGVRHADGRQLQRVGIQPTIKVAPTIKGIVAGKDEILEAAIKYLKSTGTGLQNKRKGK